jgi:cytochrome c biogenesis protein CcdA
MPEGIIPSFGADRTPQLMQMPYRDGYPLPAQRSDANSVNEIVASIQPMTFSRAAARAKTDEINETARESQLSRWLLGTFGIAVVVSILGFLLALVGGALVWFKLAVTGMVIMIVGLVVTSVCINIARQARQSC